MIQLKGEFGVGHVFRIAPEEHTAVIYQPSDWNDLLPLSYTGRDSRIQIVRVRYQDAAYGILSVGADATRRAQYREVREGWERASKLDVILRSSHLVLADNFMQVMPCTNP